MTFYAETNMGESVLNYKCLGHGSPKKFLTANARKNNHNNCALYKKMIEEKSSRTLKNDYDLKNHIYKS